MDETERIASIATRELGTGAEVVERIEEGRLHETYVVRAEGSEYVLQVSETEEHREIGLQRGFDCYRFLADSAVPVPDAISGVNEFDGRKYVLVELLPGETADRDVSPRRTRNAGRQLAHLHDAVSFDETGWLAFEDGDPSLWEFGEGSLRERRHRRVRENVEYLREAGLEAVATRVAELLRRDRLIASESSDVVLCHNDFHPGNLLYRGADVCGVIDFDHAYAGYAHRDVVKAATKFWTHDVTADWDVRQTFYDGYRGVNDLDSPFSADEPKYRIETLVVYVGGNVRDGGFSEDRRDIYTERLQDAIERVTRQ